MPWQSEYIFISEICIRQQKQKPSKTLKQFIYTKDCVCVHACVSFCGMCIGIWTAIRLNLINHGTIDAEWTGDNFIVSTFKYFNLCLLCYLCSSLSGLRVFNVSIVLVFYCSGFYNYLRVILKCNHYCHT